MTDRQKKAKIFIKIFTGLLIIQVVLLLLFLAERDFHISYKETSSQSDAFLRLIGHAFGLFSSIAFIIAGRQEFKVK